MYIIILIITSIIIYYIRNKDKKKEITDDSKIIFLIIKEKIKELINYCLILNDINFINYIKNINEKFYYTDIYENNMNNDNTSYTINKGDEMILCIRSKNDYKIHNLNDLLYVVIHEIAHIGCPEIGHTQLFYKINIYLLERAIEKKIYKYEDYNKNPREYCGVQLDNTIIK
jgi:hypothetical protein